MGNEKRTSQCWFNGEACQLGYQNFLDADLLFCGECHQFDDEKAEKEFFGLSPWDEENSTIQEDDQAEIVRDSRILLRLVKTRKAFLEGKEYQEDIEYTVTPEMELEVLETLEEVFNRM